MSDASKRTERKGPLATHADVTAGLASLSYPLKGDSMHAFISSGFLRQQRENVVADLVTAHSHGMNLTLEGQALNEYAEREARAILAETQRATWGEEKPLGFLAARHEERWPDYPCIDCAAGLALTEALAAFVEG